MNTSKRGCERENAFKPDELVVLWISGDREGMYEVSKGLEKLGIEVRYMGEPPTDYLREGNYRVINV